VQRSIARTVVRYISLSAIQLRDEVARQQRDLREPGRGSGERGGKRGSRSLVDPESDMVDKLQASEMDVYTG
jgi:hypothetical protein